MVLPGTAVETLYAATICGGFVKIVQQMICNNPIFLTYGVDPYDFNTVFIFF